MSLIRAKAEQVASHMISKSGVSQATALDPATIAMIIKVIIELIKMYQACKKKPENALDTMKNPGIVGKATLKFVIWRQLGRAKAKELGNQIMSGVQEVGETSTVHEVKQMYAEVAG